MSSATSIERVNAKDTTAAGAHQAAGRPDTFQPWHFFVLASLLAATVAVVVARESRPEQLVVISLTIGAAGFAAGALYRTLAPLVSRDPAAFEAPLTESLRAVLEREKFLVLRSIKELEFDRAMGKVSTKDFDEMAGRLRSRAMSLMRQLDSSSAYRELIERDLNARLRKSGRASRGGAAATAPPIAAATAPSDAAIAAPAPAAVCACGTTSDADAAFCRRCGARLASSSS